jgi:hypothetical protein
VDELNVTTVLAVPPSARAALQAANDHVDRPLVILERAVGVACLRWGRQVAHLTMIFRRVVVTSPVVTAIVVLAATSIVTVVVVLTT